MEEEMLLTRESLYERVWAEPAAKISGEFGISDVAVGKLCKKMNVPKPPRGHWARVQAGQKITRPPLPPPRPETVLRVVIHPPTKVELPESAEGIKAERLQVSVPDDLADAPPFLLKAVKYVSALEFVGEERIDLPAEEGLPALSVSPAQFDRAILLLNGLILALRRDGYDTAVSNASSGESTRATKGGAGVTISLAERMRIQERELTKEERKKPPYLLDNLRTHRPDGTLILTVKADDGRSQVWRDRKHEPLEDRLGEVVTAIMKSIEFKLDRMRKQEAERLAREEAARKREEEQRRRGQLERDAAEWRKCEDIRAYLRAFEARIIEVEGRIDPTGQDADWLRWAHRYADSMDPLLKIGSITAGGER